MTLKKWESTKCKMHMKYYQAFKVNNELMLNNVEQHNDIRHLKRRCGIDETQEI